MSTPVVRSPWTALLLTRFATLGKPVGDGVIPADGGWQGSVDAPGSTFVPYLVISEVTASHSWGALDDPQSDWQLPYIVESFGITREQCGWMADKARGALDSLLRTTQNIAGTNYGVMWINHEALGAPVRVDATQPPIWHSQDGLTVWITKES